MSSFERVTRLTAAILKVIRPGRKSLITSSRPATDEKPSMTRSILCTSAIGMRTNDRIRGSK
jgi:hypothetical protein